MKVTNERILERVKRVEGLTIAGGRVKIKPELAEALVEDYRGRRRPHHLRKEDWKKSYLEEETVLSLGYLGNTHILDLETDKLRPLTTRDVIDSTKLVDSLYDWGVRGGTPGAPQDVPPHLRRVLQCKIGYEGSRSASYAPFENYIEAKYIRQMAKMLVKDSMWMCA